jgi:DNA-binding LacI/PurR family transcriptional regulator
VTTVSRALTEPRLVSKSTLARVLAAAKQLAYRPNPAARSLITGKTGNIGIIVPDLENPFYTSVLRGVQTRAHQAGYAVLLADSGEDPVAEANLVDTMTNQVDGVVICAPFATDAQLRQQAEVTSLVLINRALPGISAALMDLGRGMRQVVVHLAGLGHRRCAYLGGPPNAWSNRARLRGLRAAVKLHDIELIELGPFEPKFEGGMEAADVALDTAATAIVAFNDMMALGVLSRLTARGMSVPREVSIVGADDILYAAMCAPPLTTLEMPMELAGSTAVDLLLAKLANPRELTGKAPHRRLATELIVRATTGPPAGAPTARRLARGTATADLGQESAVPRTEGPS